MKKFTSIISILSIILLNVNAETLIHFRITDKKSQNSILDGYELDYTEDNDISTIDNNEIAGKAIVDTLDNDSINIDDTIESRSKGIRSPVFLLPMLAVFSVFAIASIGLLINKKVKKTKPRRRSLHFEDDDELSKILVPTPASAVNNEESFTIRNITKESITSNNDNHSLKKDVAFLPINHAYKSILPWNPKHLDEIKLNVGDIVCVKKCYSDGYSYGRNVTSRVEGVFPTCCLSSMEELIDQAAIEDWINTGMFRAKKRTTSLFLTDVAYRI